MAVAAPSEDAPKREHVRYTDTCRGCGRQVKRHSRKGMTWRCPHCKRTNPGPGLVADLAKPPEPGARRRQARRQADAEKAGAPTAAPVRRKRAAAPAASADVQPRREAPAPKRQPAVNAPAPKVNAPAPKVNAPAPKVNAPAPKVNAPAPKPTRRGLLDRLIWGDDE